MSEVLTEVLQGDDGDVRILIEVDEAPTPTRSRRAQDYGPMRGGGDEVTTAAFQKGMDLIRTCAEQVTGTVARVRDAARPDAVEVQLGIKFNKEGNALIAKAGVEAQLQVTLKWNRPSQ